jgi:hypothetical protein
VTVHCLCIMISYKVRVHSTVSGREFSSTVTGREFSGRGRRRIYWCLANAERVRKHLPCCACYTHARCVRARCACVSCACTPRSLSFTRFRSPLPPRRTLASSPLISALHLLSLSSLLLNLVSLVVCVVVQGQTHHRSSLTTLASHLDDGLLRHTT